jgi:tellurite methyltransferase
MARAKGPVASSDWPGYYRWTARRPPRELLIRTLQQLEWENRPRRGKKAIDIGCGAGTDSLELLRRGWKVLAIDQQPSALNFLDRRVPSRHRGALTLLVSPMEGLSFPKADLIYASFSLPFCSPKVFPRLWANIRQALVPGGHFAGQLFGDRDEWVGKRPMIFHTIRQVRALTRGYRVDLFRETEEEGQSFSGSKHWHCFELILEKSGSADRSG